MTAEEQRLRDEAARRGNWKRWGPYLSERQWGTVREDYSDHGTAWHYFPHDHARSRAYRWGEDGLLGISDRQCRLCFAVALWNGRDPILKERLFGLTGAEGNHGEDVKEEYFYVDATPTHSYLKGLYKYPLEEYPYGDLVHENARRGRLDPEYELVDTGVLAKGYADVLVEYAKHAPEDICIRITVTNRSDREAQLVLLPQLWFRNTWSWGRRGEGDGPRPSLRKTGDGAILAEHVALGEYRLVCEGRPTLLFTDNDTNAEDLFGSANPSPFVKDAFHAYVVNGRRDAVNPSCRGTKAGALHALALAPGESHVVRLRLHTGACERPFGAAFRGVFQRRIREADAFHAARMPDAATDEERAVVRQAYAGLIWTKQFFYYVVREWIDGDPAHGAPASRRSGRNAGWDHLHNRDVISMPDKWEYPWYAAWDLAFHMIPFAVIDPDFAKSQLLLFLREWYMHPNGQLPAYEWALDDVNPPVHAWACWRVYKMTGARGERDVDFLERTFQKLVLNFTWWVNRKDEDGRNLFSGGFLGLDNIGVFDRSRPLPTGGHLEQADGTAWMASYCATMLSMALELAQHRPAYEDMASKFFEHFVAIAEAVNSLGGTGLWDDEDGFYYDQLHAGARREPLKVRSLVGLAPLLAVEIIEDEVIEKLPGFRKRLTWFLANRPDLARRISYMETHESHAHGHHLLAIPSRERLERVLRYLLDEAEFLSPHGIRSLSRVHADRPFVMRVNGDEHRVSYAPGESDTELFGGNSNWRGPIWLPMNYLLVEALERYHHFYGDGLRVECPTGSGNLMNLGEVAEELSRRLSSLFLADAEGRRPCHGGDMRFAADPHYKDLVLFHEYFHGDDGRGLGASHQTGWTALAVRFLKDRARARQRRRAKA